MWRIMVKRDLLLCVFTIQAVLVLCLCDAAQQHHVLGVAIMADARLGPAQAVLLSLGISICWARIASRRCVQGRRERS